jgi:antitoxin MazE
VNLPKSILDRHHLDTGDTAYAVDTEDAILITPYDPNFAKAMEIAAALAPSGNRVSE